MKMQNGRFKGTPIESIPTWYIESCLANIPADSVTATQMRRVLALRDSQKSPAKLEKERRRKETLEEV
jgi:hypothetical protein